MKQISDERLKEILKAFLEELEPIGFAYPEKKWVDSLTGEETIEEILQQLVDYSVELNTVLEQFPASITITTPKGVTERINKRCEVITGLKKENLIGWDSKNPPDIEYFQPSIDLLVMKAEKEVSIIQNVVSGEAMVTGAPIRNRHGETIKMVSNAQLMSDIEKLYTYEETRNEAVQIPKPESIIAESYSMKWVVSLAEQIARSDSSVVISGESGVGKGVIARYIHERSLRSKAPFVTIRCGAIPETLIESELFGYEAGAFTGATSKGKKGLIEMADGGTLFLDEVEAMSLPIQIKLLNFLQERTIIRVGGTKEIPIDVRIIAATNQDLMGMVKEGVFREDLYYRLNVIPIDIPPLRDRKEDILPAAEHFAHNFEKKYRKKCHFSQSFRDSLLEKEWRGNLRELENYMERAVIVSDFESGLYDSKDDDGLSAQSLDQLSFKEKMDAYEGQLVREAWQKTHNTYRIAELLGISQPSAFRKVKKYVSGFQEK